MSLTVRIQEPLHFKLLEMKKGHLERGVLFLRTKKKGYFYSFHMWVYNYGGINKG